MIRAASGQARRADVSSIEMKLGENEELMVRGRIFSGYWNRPRRLQSPARRLVSYRRSGRGRRGGNWRIIGRIKNLIILGSGHNITPEPIEDGC